MGRRAVAALALAILSIGPQPGHADYPEWAAYACGFEYLMNDYTGLINSDSTMYSGALDCGPVVAADIFEDSSPYPSGDPGPADITICGHIQINQPYAYGTPVQTVCGSGLGGAFARGEVAFRVTPYDNVYVCTYLEVSRGSYREYYTWDFDDSTWWRSECDLAIEAYFVSPGCSDDSDNDGDGYTDYPYDPGCVSPEDDTELDLTPPRAPSPQCRDGRDNDLDGRVDYPSDPGCVSPEDDTELDLPPPGAPSPQCRDGLDNDLDGRVDYPSDPDCTAPSDDSELKSPDGSCGQFAPFVVACLTTGSVSLTQELRLVTTTPAASHSVAGFVDRYRFVGPGGITTALPCVVLTASGAGTVNPCATAGGTFVERVATLINNTINQQQVVTGQPLVTVRICAATLWLTVAGFGIESAPAYALC